MDSYELHGLMLYRCTTIVRVNSRLIEINGNEIRLVYMNDEIGSLVIGKMMIKAGNAYNCK
jgi:hypothetical protein